MIDFLDTIPKDLPKTDPLLFSFVVICQAAKLNIILNGNSERALDKQLPAFEYAVNTWTIEEDVQDPDYKFLNQTVVCALWKNKPETLEDCKIEWSKYPDGTETEKQQDMDYLYLFEDWRNGTFQELQQIISMLFVKSDSKQDGKQTLADIFGWDLTSPITFVYAKDATANKFYGVGATFTMQSPFIECCPKIDTTILQKSWFIERGFLID